MTARNGGMSMMDQLSSYTVLNNGVKMPWLGLGVYKTQDGAEVENAVKAALKFGYRSIDTATFYQNEAGVGKALKESGVPRNEIFVTTKVWNDMQGYDKTLASFEESKKKLGLEYIDLYLVHWPIPGKFTDTWRALERLYREGQVRAIGVSNFYLHHLKELFASCEVKPAVDQIELHPCLTQKEMLNFCKENDIQVEAWAPLMRGRILDHPIITEIANKYRKTPSQVILRWHLQHRIVAIPKSVHEHRIIENANIFDFNLSSEDMVLIDSLNRNERTGSDPDVFVQQWA